VQCEERAAASWGGRSSLSGPGRSCDVAALGGSGGVALVIRFGNWFDLLTEEEVCFPCNLLQNR
jgi:hypothetical protein